MIAGTDVSTEGVCVATAGEVVWGKVVDGAMGEMGVGCVIAGDAVWCACGFRAQRMGSARSREHGAEEAG